MATHFYDDCPAMTDGDEMLDKEGLDLEDWVYDCPTCQYVEQVEETAWAGVSTTDCKRCFPAWTNSKRPLTWATPSSRRSGFC